MTQHAASLDGASIIGSAYGTGWFVLSLESKPQGSRIKCTIAERKGVRRLTLERALAASGIRITDEGKRPHFWIDSPDILTAVRLMIEIFDGLYEVEPPEFWYYTENEPKMEFCVQGYDQDHPDRIALTCCTWRDKEESSKNLNGFDAVLRDSGLCVPASIKHGGRTFYASLTEVATEDPLESFLALVNLHLAYLEGLPGNSAPV